MIYLDKSINKPLYEQLYEEIKQEIIMGELSKNKTLSSVRVMVKELQVSRNTVERAYQQLLAEGYIRSVPGSGYYVEDIANDYLNSYSIQHRKERKVSQPKKKEVLKYDFEYASIDSNLFPWDKWRKYIQNAILEEASHKEIAYEKNKGSLALRTSLCKYLRTYRGVNCSPEQIIICAGTQFGMEILTHILPNTKYKLAFEEPGFDGMPDLFLNRGYNITPIPVLGDGVDLVALNNTNCNLLYITPSHQFPTGTVTPISKRNKLLRWAYSNEAYIIENDYESEFRYGTKPVPSLQSLDQYDKVIYVGTLSKVLSPSVRCAYIVLPEKLLDAYDEQYGHFYAALPTYNQIALARFIEDGLLEKHVRKVVLLNERKYKVLTKTIKELLEEKIKICQQPAGVHTLVNIYSNKSQEEMIEEMKQASVGIYGTKQYWYHKANAPENLFLLGFNALSEAQIISGCQRMQEVLKYSS